MLSSEEQETLDSYNKIAVGWTGTLRSDFWKSEYERFTNFQPKGKILDLGCGSGRDCKWFLSQGYGYTGVDISERMVEIAKRDNPKGNFLVQSFYELDLPLKSFDGLWAVCSLLHIPKHKLDGILTKVKTFLKPGAVGFIVMKEGQGEKMVEWQNSGHKRFFVYYSQDEFERILQDCGFEVLEKSKRLPQNENEQDGIFLVYYVKSV